MLAVRLAGAADRFEVELPAHLPLPAGPVVASGSGFRVGGSIGSSGNVAWQHKTGDFTRMFTLAQAAYFS